MLTASSFHLIGYQRKRRWSKLILRPFSLSLSVLLLLASRNWLLGGFLTPPARTLTPAEPRYAPLGEALGPFLWFSAQPLKFSVDPDEALA